MNKKILLFDLLGVDTLTAAAALWPPTLLSLSDPPVDDHVTVVSTLQAVLEFQNVHAGVDGTVTLGTGGAGQIAIAADLHVRQAVGPFFLATMPHFGIALETTEAGAPARAFFVRDGRGFEVLLEAVPVKLTLQAGVLEPIPPDSSGTPVDVGDASAFHAGDPDGFAAVLKPITETEIYVKARIRLTPEGDVFFEPNVPVSASDCVLFGIPATAVYDLSLIPSPKRIEIYEWARHDLSSPFGDDGAIGFRSIDVNYPPKLFPKSTAIGELQPFRDLLQRLSDCIVKADDIELVCEDAVFPLNSPLPIPWASHGLFGLRRKLDDPDSLENVYSLKKAPVQIPLYHAGKCGTKPIDPRATSVVLSIERLFFRSGRPSPEVLFEGTVIWNRPNKGAIGALVGIDDDWTVQAGMVFASDKGGPIHLFSIMNANVELHGAKVGLGVGRLRKGRAFENSWQALGDFAIVTPKSGQSNKTPWIQIRSIDGDDAPLILRDLGWSFGKIHRPDLKSPGGMQLIFGGAVHLIIEEMGWVEDPNGASYFSFTGGVALPLGKTKTNAGGTKEQPGDLALRLRRLRFRTSPHEGAPFFKVDGIFLNLQWDVKKGKVRIYGFGYVREATTPLWKLNEWGLGVEVEFPFDGKTISIAAAFLRGTATAISDPQQRFIYFLGSFELSYLPIGSVDLFDVRMLFAHNLTPRISGRGGELPLFQWYRKNKNALLMPEDRALTVWDVQNNAVSAGIGCGFSFPTSKRLFHVDLFIFVAQSEKETGVLFVGEFFLKDGKEPIAWLAAEYDVAAQKLGVLIGVDLKVGKVISGLPSWLDIAKLSGSLYVGNKPWTLRIGHLADQRSWLALSTTSTALGLQSAFVFAVCFEKVEGPQAAFGVLFDYRAHGDWAVGAFNAYFSFGLIIGAWTSGSNTTGTLLWIGAGFSIRLFRCLRFGADISLRITYLGKDPWFTTISVTFEIRTPRFFPRFTFRFEKTWSSEEAFRQKTLQTNLDLADGLSGYNGSSLRLPSAPLIVSSQPIGPGTLLSFNDLAAAQEFSGMPPGTIPILPTTATIALTFAHPMSNDMALAPDTGDAGRQQVQSIGVRNALKSLGVRRSDRYGANRGVWKNFLDESTSILDSSGNSSVTVSPALSFRWQLDAREGGKLIHHQLLLNGSTAYKFTIADPQADEEALRDPLSAPCCADHDLDREQPAQHLLTPGAAPQTEPTTVTRDDVVVAQEDVHDHAVVEVRRRRLPSGTRIQYREQFSRNGAWWQWMAAPTPIAVPLIVPAGGVAGWEFLGLGLADFEQHFGQVVPGQDLSTAAFLHAAVPAILGSADLEEPAISAHIALTIPGTTGGGTLVFEAFHGLEVVGSFTTDLSVAGPIGGMITVLPEKGITRLVLRTEGLSTGTTLAQGGHIVSSSSQVVSIPTDLLIAGISYVTVEESIRAQGAKTRCHTSGGATGGAEKLAWLSNKLYEITVRSETRMSSRSQGARAVVKAQKTWFFTKGLPGTNAVPNTGDELRPLVESVYPPDPKLPLYRDEPTAIAFTELMSTVLPVPRTVGPNDPDEKTQKMDLALNIDRTGSIDGMRRITVASDDWLDVHRSSPRNAPAKPVVATTPIATAAVREATTLDPARLRYERLLASSKCSVDPLHSSQVLLHQPIGADGTSGPWEPQTTFRATVRLSSGPHLHRDSFDAVDVPALSVRNEAGSSVPAWTVSPEGFLLAPADPGRQYASFGDAGWVHLQAQVQVDPGAASAGIAVGVSGGTSPQAIVATVSTQGSDRLLSLERRDGTTVVQIPPVTFAAPAGPVSLTVIAFDDRVRAVAGEATLEIDRETVREGQVALVSDGGAAFQSVTVDALDMYTFDFTTSRYRTFEEHIQSYDGMVRTFDPSVIGVAPAISTASWLATHRAEADALMRPNADPQQRQALFTDLSTSQVIPLIERLDRLTVTRITSAVGTIALLVESPETLSLSRDVRVALRGPVNPGSLPQPGDTPVPLIALTNGDETAVLLLPDGDLNDGTFGSGAFALDFALTRNRWRADSSPPGAIYAANARITFEW
jgi:hypothetical protein